MLLAASANAWSQAGAKSDRVALVIGNSDYQFAPLDNPRNDARAMSALLAEAGFSVQSEVDTSLQVLQSAVERFGKAIRDPQVKFGLFYYAGHGLQLDWHNYLVPVSARIRSAADVTKQTVDVTQLLRYMEEAKGRNFLVILDACRDDPFGDSYRAPAKGLSQFDAPVGSMLAYATAPGSVASDGAGINSLYTANLLREFSVRGARLEDAFKRVRLNVRLASEGRQIPWESTSLEEDVYLFPDQRKKLSDEDQDRLFDEEIRSWMQVKATNDHLQLVKFIREYPSGSASELAQARLNRILKSQAVQVASASLPVYRTEKAVDDKPAAPGPAPLATERPVQPDVVTPAVVAVASSPPPAPAPAPQPVPVPVAQAVLTLAPTPFSKGYSEHQRTYRVGEVMSFSVIDGLTKVSRPLVMRVTAVNVDEDRVEFNGGEYVIDTMGNTLATQRGAFSTPRQFYPAELYVGKKWHTTFKQRRSNGQVYTYRYDVRVVGRESITVPAGTFDAFKIEARGFNMQLGASLARNIWVTPGVPADIAHETIVRLRNGVIEQFDRQELTSLQPRG
ncbi:MAG: hypothetical protein NVS3B2_01450 [Ramlibacter sp.]